MAASLALAGCDNPPDNLSPSEKPLDRPVSEQTDTGMQVDLAPEQKETGEPAPTGGKEKTHKPLDLSMPPQPDADARNNTGTSGKHLLPDLFQPEQKPDDDSSIHLRGQVLMKPGAEQDFDSLEGGEVIIEMKTR